jgi:hypothetical protein
MQRLSVRPVAGRAWEATWRPASSRPRSWARTAQRRFEEFGRRLAGAELVQAEAGVVEELRLARLLGEGVERLAGDRQVEAGELARRRRRGGREARLDRGATGPVRSLAAIGRRFADGQGDDGRGDGGRGGVGVGVVESDCHARVIGRS